MERTSVERVEPAAPPPPPRRPQYEAEDLDIPAFLRRNR
jgi:hypothetical protein